MVTYHVASKVVGVVTIPYAAEYNLMMIPTKFKTENIAENHEHFYFRMKNVHIYTNPGNLVVLRT